MLSALGRFHLTRVYRARNYETSVLSCIHEDAGLPTRFRLRSRSLRVPMISTFIPTKLSPSDYVDFSHKRRVSLHSPLSITHCVSASPLFFGPRTMINEKPIYNRFPADSRGFIYYYKPPYGSPIAGELRMRLTPTHDPSSFATGSDLLLSTGLPWSLPLIRISGQHGLHVFAEQLLAEGLITQDLLATCKRIYDKRLHSGSVILHSLEQPFPVNFHQSRFTVRPVAQDRAGHCLFLHLFCDWRRHHSGQQPYIGSAIARFELSTLAEHAQEKHLVVRILDIVEPAKCLIPDYDGYIPVPTAGSLVVRGSPRGPKIWSMNLHSTANHHRDMQLLLTP